MGLLTNFEREILVYSKRGLTDYKIARELSNNIPTVSRARKNALRKLKEAEEDLAWAKSLGIQNFNVVPRRTVIEKSPELRPAF